MNVPNRSCYKSIIILSCWLFLLTLPGQSRAIDLSQTTQIGLYFQAQRFDLDFSGDIRDTRIFSIDLEVREQLTRRLDGAIWLGHLTTDQSSNPIQAGQDTVGDYAGLDLRYRFIDSNRYDLIGQMHYRYTETGADLGGQDIVWEWHEAGIGLLNQIYISNDLYLGLDLLSRVIDGREKASGNVDQNTDFEGKDGVFGRIRLQFELDRSGHIAMEAMVGSVEGGRIAFLRNF